MVPSGTRQLAVSHREPAAVLLGYCALVPNAFYLYAALGIGDLDLNLKAYRH